MEKLIHAVARMLAYFLFMGWPLALFGQPVQDTMDLSVLRVDADSFPVVKVYFRAEYSSGTSIPLVDLDGVKVIENGRAALLGDVRAVNEDIPVHMALVLDRSASMMDDYLYRFDTVNGQLILAAQALRAPGAPYPFEQAQAAILRLASQFSGSANGLYLVSFSDRVDALAPMQQDTAPLAATMRGLRATGRTAFYDALMAGLGALASTPGLRAVVALTDGSDNASAASMAQVVARARALQVPLYLVGLGNVDRDSLRHLAVATRGACYLPSNASMLMPIYRDISHRVRHVHCAAYRSQYPAAADEEVRIEVRTQGGAHHLRGHGGRYRVPAAALEASKASRSLRWILLGAGGLLGGLMALLGTRALLRRLRPHAQLPDLPSLLPPPQAFPTPTKGPLTVTVRLAGDAPLAWLLLATPSGRVLHSYECSGHQIVLQLSLGHLPRGRYQLCLHDGEARSSAVTVILHK